MSRLRQSINPASFILCLVFLLTLLGAFPAVAQQTQNATAQALAARPNDDSIVLTVTVTDEYGRPASGLIKSDFTVNDKTPQEITFFSSSDEPISVGIVLDASGSMGTPGDDRFKRIKESLAHFMRQSHQENEYFLLGFNKRPQLLIDWTRDGNAVLEKLGSVETKFYTAFYDACYLALNKLARGRHPKRVMLLISDGLDNESKYTFRELKRSLKESDILLYAIGMLPGDSGSSLSIEGQSILEELASDAGGKAFFPASGAELNEILKLIGYELRRQYLLGFKPTDSARDGKWHSVKVKVKLPPGAAQPGLSLYVRTRKGFYAPKN